ncbi:phospholipase A1 1-like [Macrosteles quadrilineatus]|uniref:phospholipase A1 1-like n=1 Tax=Macrosteles quadrilineatus TaxID=74068 RepID=UPI0023E0996D|nr:phospholipase A1 1-like [Macrosteles quadrilineatus]XP_054263933.1 phospholipase A1 1-like [Macrosteles quadrilineatus]
MVWTRPWSSPSLLQSCVILLLVQGTIGLLWNAFDIDYWRCKLKRNNVCPDEDIRIFLYSPDKSYATRIQIHSPLSLQEQGWDPLRKNVIIIHGFNGTESKTPMTFIRDAYIHRGDYNIFTIDWEILTPFPCYLSAISNSRLVAQCSAQFYSYLTHSGAPAHTIHCVGHSLGAHICGMMSNHLTEKMHKIIGLDPARPLVDRYGSRAFRLTRDDAHIVQVFHTNAGLLGEVPQVGHVDFCINGGRMQPSCRKEGRRIRQARCSHFLSSCFFAATISEAGSRHKAAPCSVTCRPLPPPLGGLDRTVSMGVHTPETVRGTYCIRMDDAQRCPFD